MVVPCMTPSSVSSTLLGSPSCAFSPPASLVAYLAISTSREETLQSALLAAGPRGATPRVFQHGRRCRPNWRRGAWSSKRFLSGTARCADHFPALRFTERRPGGHEHWPFASLVSMLLVRRPCASILPCCKFTVRPHPRRMTWKQTFRGHRRPTSALRP